LSPQKATSPQFWPQTTVVDINAIFEFLELLSVYAHHKVFTDPESAARHKPLQLDAQQWVKHLFDHYILLLLDEKSAPQRSRIHPRMLAVPLIMLDTIGPSSSMIAWLDFVFDPRSHLTPITIPSAKRLMNIMEILKIVPEGLWDSFAVRWDVRKFLALSYDLAFYLMRLRVTAES
jgi:hypothetical protein